MISVLFVTQEISFDFGCVVPCRSSMAVILWLEIDVFQLKKHNAYLKSYIFNSVHKVPLNCQFVLPRSEFFS
jgi:hypothetical protein